MYQLNRESVQLALLGNDPANPNAVVVFADAKPTDGSSQHKIVYLVLEGHDNVGQGLSNYGASWEATLDFYTERFAPQGLAAITSGTGLIPDLSTRFFEIAEQYLSRTQCPVPTATEAPVDTVEQNLAAGICRTPAEFSRHVSVLAKDLTEFRYTYDHLAMFAALTHGIARAGDDLDFVKKASLYEDESKLQGVSPEFRAAMLEVLEADTHHGDGKALVHPAALAQLEQHWVRDVVHMLVGAIGEAGELAATLHTFLTTGELKLEGKDGLPEEIGDSRFYLSGLLRFLGSSEEENNQLNFDKLKARYPAGFSNTAALNRDLAAEDQALRGN